MVGPGGGLGEVATPACRTGLPLNLLGSVATGAGAGAAATGFAADRLRTFARSSAFSFSILSRRAITSSRVADRAAPLNETRQRAAQAVPERSLFFMAIPQSRARFNFRARRSVVYAKCQLEGSRRPLDAIFSSCRKNGTVILLQCSKLSRLCEILTHPWVARIELRGFTGP